MKHLVSTLLALIIIALPSLQALAAPVNMINNEEIPFLERSQLTGEQKNDIQSELSVLNDFHIDPAIIESVNTSSNGNIYTLNYDGFNETVFIESINDDIITIIANDGERSNTVSYVKDGSIILDGFKVQISEEYNVENAPDISPMGTVWKCEKSLTPYGSHKASDYSKFITSTKQNIALGKALDTLTATALTAVIGTIDTFAGIAVSLLQVAKEVRDALLAVNPKTQYLGCLASSYTIPKSDGSDVKYINKFYANQACTGTYKTQLTYAHYTVY